MMAYEQHLSQNAMMISIHWTTARIRETNRMTGTSMCKRLLAHLITYTDR
jgi:hypothetical protein